MRQGLHVTLTLQTGFNFSLLYSSYGNRTHIQRLKISRANRCTKEPIILGLKLNSVSHIKNLKFYINFSAIFIFFVIYYSLFIRTLGNYNCTNNISQKSNTHKKNERIKASRVNVESNPKYSAIPPHTPANFLSFVLLQSFFVSILVFLPLIYFYTFYNFNYSYNNYKIISFANYHYYILCCQLWEQDSDLQSNFWSLLVQSQDGYQLPFTPEQSIAYVRTRTLKRNLLNLDSFTPQSQTYSFQPLAKGAA